MITLEIINPIVGKGANKEHTSFRPDQKEVDDEENYVVLGCIVRDEKGNARRDANVVITATDQSQNKTFTSTGVQKKIYTGEEKRVTPFYPFTYYFKNKGKHTITFTCEGVTASIDLDVKKDKPKPVKP